MRTFVLESCFLQTRASLHVLLFRLITRRDQKAFDAMGLDGKDVRALHNVFKAVDTDHSGAVDTKEFFACVVSCGRCQIAPNHAVPIRDARCTATTAAGFSLANVAVGAVQQAPFRQ